MVGTADSFERYCVLQLKAKLGGNLRTIYYNSSPFIPTGMTHGQLDAGILNPSEAVEGILSGKLRVLASFTPISQSEIVPTVPTLADLGIDGLDYGISGRAGSCSNKQVFLCGTPVMARTNRSVGD